MATLRLRVFPCSKVQGYAELSEMKELLSLSEKKEKVDLRSHAVRQSRDERLGNSDSSVAFLV